MANITRFASSVTSPFGGGSAWNSFNTSGGSASASASSSGGGAPSTQFKGCQWSNFGAPVPGTITSVRMKYDWDWFAQADGSVDSDGSCSAESQAAGGAFAGSAAISLFGPGPVSDFDDDSNSGSADVALPVNTVLSSLSTNANVRAFADSGVIGSTGQASAFASVEISSLRVEIITSEGNKILLGSH